jgi:AcrR family transcriptional regulator
MNDIAENALDATRQENVTRILDAAERLFRHYGYSKTTVADIARDLGMSPANVYRFFSSKIEIHQAICGRMLAASYQQAYDIRHLPITAAERLKRYVRTQYTTTVETMIDQEKVHEMVVVAIERDWHVIEKHIDSIQDLLAEVIREGIEAGEFVDQDPIVASRCFGAATMMLCHPIMVAECLTKTNRASVDDLIDFAVRALKK